MREPTLFKNPIIQNVHRSLFSVIGLSDGLTVPFALAAGLSALGESKYVVLAGVAELIAGCISMGIGGFLASQSERDHYRYLRHQTAIRVDRSCAGEMDREVAEILSPVGVSDKACSAVAQSLREAEEDYDERLVPGANGDTEAASLRWSKDVGLTAFFLKFGKGMGTFFLSLLSSVYSCDVRTEEVPVRRLYISAFTIGMGYLIGGIIPLLPYVFIPQAQIALIYSSVVTGLVLLIFGAVKSHITGAGVGTYGYIWGALSTLLVGGLAAGAAFGLVRILET
jgi:vacuolar iron transporter family protein